MQPALRSVPTTNLEPPYPADTAANGFKQEVDFSRILSSRTWTLADNECRPWLLMLWQMSWLNVPVGTWEADDEYIAARIGCKLEWFSGHRSQLMRGWVRHSDGLMYHPFIIEQVNTMLSRRNGTRNRMRKFRELGKSSDSSVTLCDASPAVTYAKEQDQEQEQDKSTHPTDESPNTSGEESGRPGHAPCPYGKIRDLWIEMLPELTKPSGVEHWTDNRKRQIRLRWVDQLPDLNAWRECFAAVRRSAFLMGQSTAAGRRPFKADLFWVTKPENLLKLAEGKYHG